MQGEPDGQLRFIETSLGRQKRLTENVAKTIFFIMTAMMVLPLLLIVGYLLYKALPALSLEFLFTNPKRGMTAGGIWAPALGTMYLVTISLLVSAPIGVLAAVYLNEYARENWFTRIVNLAVVNLAGVPRHRPRPVRVGCFCTIRRYRKSILAAASRWQL